MEFTLLQIADLLGGTIEGNEEVLIKSFSKIEEGGESSITFLANPKYTKFVYTTTAAAIIVSKEFQPEKLINPSLLRVDDPYKSVAKLLDIYNQLMEKPKGFEKQSYIDKTARTGKNIYIGAFSYISKNAVIGDNSLIYPGSYIGKNVKIGSNCTLFPGVKIYDNCEIGNNCVIHAGSIIGSDGFGFAPNENSEFIKIAQIGNVIIEDNVEIGALVTIDRATIGSTIIRKGVKLDNQNHIAHNVEIGENTVIAAQSGIAGTAKIGKNCMFGGQVGISPHIDIADKTKIAAQSGIAKSIRDDDQVVMGSPAIGIKDFHKSYIHFKNLDKLVKRLDELEKKTNDNFNIEKE